MEAVIALEMRKVPVPLPGCAPYYQPRVRWTVTSAGVAYRMMVAWITLGALAAWMLGIGWNLRRIFFGRPILAGFNCALADRQLLGQVSPCFRHLE